MRTSGLTHGPLVLLALLLTTAGCGEDAKAPVVDDQSWDDLTPEQRRTHLEQQLEQSVQTLETTADAADWHAASDAAIDALSNLRRELIETEPERYEALEADVERLTDNPPVFARGQ